MRRPSSGGCSRFTVTDFGKGMPEGALRKFRGNGMNMGVGLSGMRERLADLDGELNFSIRRKRNDSIGENTAPGGYRLSHNPKNRFRK
jgi:glucose-6-phosphate-specific signal transduction histidine kinase